MRSHVLSLGLPLSAGIIGPAHRRERMEKGLRASNRSTCQQSSRVAYSGLIAEIRANIYFRAVTNKPLCPASYAVPKARRICTLVPKGASEKYDCWMHSVLVREHTRSPCSPELFIYVSLHSCTCSQKQIKMFS